MNEIIVYLITINFLMLGLLYLFSRSLERYRDHLDEFAAYLRSLQEEIIKKDEDDDTRTRT